MIIYQKIIDRSDLINNRNLIYIFGDNIREVGLGGQAKQCRGEPNALGVPTKWSPLRVFRDSDLETVKPYIKARLKKIKYILAYSGDIVFPSDGIGTGYAALEHNAPSILEYLTKELASLGIKNG